MISYPITYPEGSRSKPINWAQLSLQRAIISIWKGRDQLFGLVQRPLATFHLTPKAQAFQNSSFPTTEHLTPNSQKYSLLNFCQRLQKLLWGWSCRFIENLKRSIYFWYLCKDQHFGLAQKARALGGKKPFALKGTTMKNHLEQMWLKLRLMTIYHQTQERYIASIWGPSFTLIFLLPFQTMWKSKNTQAFSVSIDINQFFLCYLVKCKQHS